MELKDSVLREMPDSANEARTEVGGSLDWVGMNAIEIPVLLSDPSGQVIRQAASVDAYVSLDKADAKGIHMSRLYRILNGAFSESALNLTMLKGVLKDFVESQDLNNRV